MATGETTESVAFTHRILYKQHEDEKPQVYLLASRYSFLESFHLNSSAIPLFGPVNRKELLLHFTDFDTMGKRQDAELIPTSQIIEARNLEFEPEFASSLSYIQKQFVLNFVLPLFNTYLHLFTPSLLDYTSKRSLMREAPLSILAIPASSASSSSVVTVTSTYASTVTDTITEATLILTTTTLCTNLAAIPPSSACTPGVFAAGGRTYEEWCPQAE